MSKSIIILGASGFIGKSLFDYYQAAADVNLQGFSSTSCNLLNEQVVSATLAKAPAQSIVIFCSSIGRHLGESYDSMTKNILMANNVAQAIKQCGKVKHLVFLSSVCVYGLPVAELPITEKSVLNPSGYYGVSKAASEILLRSLLKEICPISILRLPGVYGSGDKQVSVIGKFISQYKQTGVCNVSGDGSTLRDFVHVNDIANIVNHCVEMQLDTTLNAVSGQSVSLNKGIETLAAVEGRSIDVKYQAQSNNRNFDLVFDNSKLLKALPNIKFTSLADGIKAYLSEK